MIAGVLPARESIWWAWVSARYGTQAEGGKPATAQVHQALTAIEQWIVRPEDSSRRAAWAAGNAAGMDTPVGMISAAVFLSGTSVAPPGSPAAPPPPDAGMPLVAGSILLASTSGRADQVTPTLVAFAAQGTEIIRRLGGWDAALKVAYETHQRQLSEYERATAPQKES